MHLCPALGPWKESGQGHILPTDQPLHCDLTSLYSCDSWMFIFSMFGYGAHTNTVSVVFCICKSSRVYQQRLDWSFSQGEFRKMWSQNLETEKNSAWELNCRFVLYLKGECRDKRSMNFMLILPNNFINWRYSEVQNISKLETSQWAI